MVHTYLNSSTSRFEIVVEYPSSLLPLPECLSHACFRSLSNICGHSPLPSFPLMAPAPNNN